MIWKNFNHETRNKCFFNIFTSSKHLIFYSLVWGSLLVSPRKCITKVFCVFFFFWRDNVNKELLYVSYKRSGMLIACDGNLLSWRERESREVITDDDDGVNGKSKNSLPVLKYLSSLRLTLTHQKIQNIRDFCFWWDFVHFTSLPQWDVLRRRWKKNHHHLMLKVEITTITFNRRFKLFFFC